MPYDNQLKLYKSAVSPASGAVTLQFTSTGPYRYRVSQISVEMSAGTAASISTAAVCAVRNNGRLVSPAIAQGDAVAGEPPEYMSPGDVISVEWSGCLAGNICAAALTYTQQPL